MNNKRIAVLLSTYNGEKYLVEQIESVLNQKEVDISLFIRDDGSTDGTKGILERYSQNNKCNIVYGENIGVANSFFCLIKQAKECDYYAFCDQDDVWDSDKIINAIEYMSNNTYNMYYSSTRVVDENLNLIDSTSRAKDIHVFNLQEILLTNNAVGCTIVFNKKLRDVMAAEGFPSKVIMHDHWVYLVCLALGGKVVYDPIAHICYRQHGNNEIGNTINYKSRIKYSSFSKMKNVRSEMAKYILAKYKNEIPDWNKEIINSFAYYKKNKKNVLKIELSAIPNFKRKIIFIAQVLLGYL